MQTPSVENLRFGEVPVPTLSAITTLLCGQPQHFHHPGESTGEDQNREQEHARDSQHFHDIAQSGPQGHASLSDE